MNAIRFAISRVLTDKSALGVFVVSASLLLVLFIAIPVVTIPGNTLQFQLETFGVRDYVLMIALAALAGLNFGLNWFALKQKKNQTSTASASVAGGVTSGVAGVFGAMVGTASCASCLAALFALVGLGTGSVLFVLDHQTYFLLGSMALLLISLYFISRKINKMCTSC